MKKLIISLLVFLGILGLLLQFGYQPLIERLGLKGRSGVKIDSAPASEVFINGKSVGATPFQDENMSEGEYLVVLSVADSTASATEQDKPSWQGYVRLNVGTLSVVNRELIASGSTGASGEVISLSQGNGVTIISTPTSAAISVDGKDRGRTPVTLSDLSPGEHQFIISHDNFLNRSIRANLVDGYNLNLNVDLALSEADLTQISIPPINTVTQLVVKKTPTGFLNVRETASTNAKVVVQVKPGDVLTLLEETANWDRIRTVDNKEGYVSATYVEKKSQ